MPPHKPDLLISLVRLLNEAFWFNDSILELTKFEAIFQKVVELITLPNAMTAVQQNDVWKSPGSLQYVKQLQALKHKKYILELYEVS